jgi:hypothetical protein
MLLWKCFPGVYSAAGAVVVGLLVAACNVVRIDAKSAHDAGGGAARVYPATYAEAWAGAHAAVHWNPTGTVVDHPDEHYLITDDTDFEQVGIWLLSLGPDTTKVTVVVMDERHTGPNEEKFLEDIGLAVDQIKKGQSVDKRP